MRTLSVLRRNKNAVIVIAAGSILLSTSVLGNLDAAFAVTINFDDQDIFGPSTFSSAGPSQTLNIDTTAGNVTFEGGTILTNTTFLPANSTSVYGTASFGDVSLMNPMTITFENVITDLSFDVINGNTVTTQYIVTDDLGNSESFFLAPNSSEGQTNVQIDSLVTQVTVLAATSSNNFFDFFVDNFTFSESSTTSIPEPISALSTLFFGTIAAVTLKKKQSS